MKISIFLISVVLFWAEWFVIRKTMINKFMPIIMAFIIGLLLGLTIGPHLVVLPILFMILAWVLCEVEDRYFKRKGMSEVEKSKLKDL